MHKIRLLIHKGFRPNATVLRQIGREGGIKNVGTYLVKRQQMGREGGHKIGKMGRCR